MSGHERGVIDQYALDMTHLTAVNSALPELTKITIFTSTLVFQINKKTLVWSSER